MRGQAVPVPIFFSLFSAARRVRPACPPARAGVLLGAAMLSACMATSPRALYELSTFDPFRADPDHVAIAVKTSRNLLLQRGDLELRIAFAAEDETHAFDETFVLAVTDGSTGVTLNQKIKPEDHVLTATIAPEDKARFETTQRRALGADSKDGEGTLSVTVKGGCRTGSLDAETLFVRSYMRTKAGGSFFPLTGEIELKELLGGKSPAGIPPCKDIPSD